MDIRRLNSYRHCSCTRTFANRVRTFMFCCFAPAPMTPRKYDDTDCGDWCVNVNYRNLRWSQLVICIDFVMETILIATCNSVESASYAVAVLRDYLYRKYRSREETLFLLKIGGWNLVPQRHTDVLNAERSAGERGRTGGGVVYPATLTNTVLYRYCP